MRESISHPEVALAAKSIDAGDGCASIPKDRRCSKLIEFKDVRIRGWMAPFTAWGNPELIRLGYEAGFSANNSTGFGMVGIRQEGK